MYNLSLSNPITTVNHRLTNIIYQFYEHIDGTKIYVRCWIKLKAIINEKVSPVITKDDTTLKDAINEVINDMKVSILKSFLKRVELIESALFDTQAEIRDNKEQG